jgi:hypothetical protein
MTISWDHVDTCFTQEEHVELDSYSASSLDNIP